MITPLFDRIYVIPIEDPERTKSGLYVPDRAKQKCDHGIVKYRGPAVRDIRVGDHVIFGGYNGTRVATADEGVLVILEEEYVEGIWTNTTPHRVFTESQVLDWIVKACGDIRVRGVDVQTSETLEQMLTSYCKDHLFAEGLLF